MSATMHLIVLVSLLTAAVCGGTSTFSSTEQGKVTSTSATNLNSLPTSSTLTTTAGTPQSQTATQQITSEVASASTQTPRTEQTIPSTSPKITPITQKPNEMVSQEQTVPSASESPNVSTTVNTTRPVTPPSALSTKWGNSGLAANPGLVAIICIFSIILALVLFVLIVKCAKSPRSNFERLEDMPMGKVNEESPFAHYSK
ncbi:putative LOC729966 homolog [Odontesthes bonariensis]|uniref:putative LOC729966 homolog n=1 Tax=Odontesthes bonariensis TaxID=219752 RepID=UPI003F5901BF